MIRLGGTTDMLEWTCFGYLGVRGNTKTNEPVASADSLVSMVPGYDPARGVAARV